MMMLCLSCLKYLVSRSHAGRISLRSPSRLILFLSDGPATATATPTNSARHVLGSLVNADQQSWPCHFLASRPRDS
jgi:hypothetical protein